MASKKKVAVLMASVVSMALHVATVLHLRRIVKAKGNKNA